MKKLLIVFMAAGLIVSFAASDVFARGIMLKGGYAMMRNDYADAEVEDTWTFGIFFDMGTFLFPSLRFMPGVDWVSIETEEQSIEDIYGIHMDWYWFFMGERSIAPFLGFGPSLNYLDRNSRNDENEDSDAGVDIFLGAMMKLGGTPFDLMIEARYRFIDIADRGANILALNLGLKYNF
jgi:hypothetical protein